MKNYLCITVLTVMTLTTLPTVAQAESNSGGNTRFRWDFAPGVSAISVGENNLAHSVTLAQDYADRRFSYRYVEYSDRAIIGSKGFFCPLGCGHEDELRANELLYGWLGTSGIMRFSLQSGVGHISSTGNFGELGNISAPVLPIVAGIVIGDLRYLRIKLEAEYVLNQFQPYFGVFVGLMLGSVW